MTKLLLNISLFYFLLTTGASASEAFQKSQSADEFTGVTTTSCMHKGTLEEPMITFKVTDNIDNIVILRFIDVSSSWKRLYDNQLDLLCKDDGWKYRNSKEPTVQNTVQSASAVIEMRSFELSKDVYSKLIQCEDAWLRYGSYKFQIPKEECLEELL